MLMVVVAAAAAAAAAVVVSAATDRENRIFVVGGGENMFRSSRAYATVELYRHRPYATTTSSNSSRASVLPASCDSQDIKETLCC